jgi:ankyrin repeat protein
MSSIHGAAYSGDVQKLQALLSKVEIGGGAVNSVSECTEETPLHRAVQEGHAECVSMLIEHGADLGATQYEAPPSIIGGLAIDRL